jgi:hypothetical protein
MIFTASVSHSENRSAYLGPSIQEVRIAERRDALTVASVGKSLHRLAASRGISLWFDATKDSSPSLDITVAAVRALGISPRHVRQGTPMKAPRSVMVNPL